MSDRYDQWLLARQEAYEAKKKTWVAPHEVELATKPKRIVYLWKVGAKVLSVTRTAGGTTKLVASVVADNGDEIWAKLEPRERSVDMWLERRLDWLYSNVTCP